MGLPEIRRLVGAAALPLAYGVAAGVWIPRGPISPGEGVAALVLGATTGLVAGVVLRSRWSMLLAPAVFMATFEAVRLDTSGPTVDAIHLSSLYSSIAFVAGRGFHGLLTLLPMFLGAAVGAGIARQRAPSAARMPRTRWSTGLQWLRRTVAGSTAVALVALGVLVARPASTAPIVDADGARVAGSVAELTTVETQGHRLGLMIRGRDADNPILLFLAGGPGGSELGAMRRHSEALEDDFVVATLDQRGTGSSYGELDPTGTLTLDAAVRTWSPRWPSSAPLR